jgi:hypothetical protein
MSRKVFTAGEVLAAADVNSFLMDQSVMSFAGSAARESAIPSPVEGMVSYLEDSDVLSIYDGSAWKVSLATTGGILQVVSTAKTDTFTTTSATYTAVTGLSATITPKFTSSKILILAQIAYGLGFNNTIGGFKVTRGGTDIYRGDASGSRLQAVFGGFSVIDNGLLLNSGAINYLDSPSSVSALTYQVEVRRTETGTVVFVNRSADDQGADNTNRVRGASSITLMEVAA